MSGRRTSRDRKSTDFFAPDDIAKPEAKTHISQGEGTKLGDIPNVTFKLDKQKGSAELLENFHQILFKSKGKAHSRKKDIKAFSGFVFDTSNKEAEIEKLDSRLAKWTAPELNALLDLLDIPRGSGEEGTKDKKIERLRTFLLKPSSSSKKDLAAQAAVKKEKGKATKEKATAKDKGSAKAAPAKAPSAKKAKKSPATKPTQAEETTAAPVSGKKRKAPASEEKPAKKAKKQAEKAGKGGKPATAAKQWPPAKDVKADVEFIFQAGLEKEEEMTMGKIYKELATKYGMVPDEVKAKKAQIKTIVKNYEAQLEIPDEQDGQAKKKVNDGPQAMDVDGEADGEDEEEAVVKDKATTEGDEVQDEVAEQAEAGDAALPEGTTDIQPAKAEDKSNADAAKSTEASKSDEPAGAAENAAPAVQDSELVSNLPPSGPLFTKEPPESKSEADDKEKPGPQQLQSSEAAPSSSVDKKANGVSPVGKDATEKVLSGDATAGAETK